MIPKFLFLFLFKWTELSYTGVGLFGGWFYWVLPSSTSPCPTWFSLVPPRFFRVFLFNERGKTNETNEKPLGMSTRCDDAHEIDLTTPHYLIQLSLRPIMQLLLTWKRRKKNRMLKKRTKTHKICPHLTVFVSSFPYNRNESVAKLGKKSFPIFPFSPFSPNFT